MSMSMSMCLQTSVVECRQNDLRRSADRYRVVAEARRARQSGRVRSGRSSRRLERWAASGGPVRLVRTLRAA
jgi:hypothetical protein